MSEVKQTEDGSIEINREVKNIAVAPTGLPPVQKRKFVEQVFLKVGYDYSKTLLDISSEKLDPSIQYHRDLAELVLLPQTGLAIDELDLIYSVPEEKAIKTLLRKL